MTISSHVGSGAGLRTTVGSSLALFGGLALRLRVVLLNPKSDHVVGLDRV